MEQEKEEYTKKCVSNPRPSVTHSSTLPSTPPGQLGYELIKLRYTDAKRQCASDAISRSHVRKSRNRMLCDCVEKCLVSSFQFRYSRPSKGGNKHHGKL